MLYNLKWDIDKPKDTESRKGIQMIIDQRIVFVLINQEKNNIVFDSNNGILSNNGGKSNSNNGNVNSNNGNQSKKNLKIILMI